MIHPSLQNKRVVGLNLEGVGCCEADGCQSGSVGSPRPTDRRTASQPAMHAWTNGQTDGATGERWNAHLLGGRKSRGERRGRKYELWQRWRHQEFKKKKKMEVCVEKSGAQRKPWVVCVRTTRRCDGRYLRSAWSSQTAYLSKASRPGLGPPWVC